MPGTLSDGPRARKHTPLHVVAFHYSNPAPGEGTVIASTPPVMVERSFYSDANGVVWAAGINATATRLP
jgi:hypothetical protein